MDRDAEHLQLLSIFHYVVGGLFVLGCSVGLFHVFFGLVMLNAPEIFSSPNHHGDPPPAFLGWLFLVMGGCVVAFGWITGGLMVYAGMCLNRRTHYVFCMIMAGIACIFMPTGTILGVCTIIVLQRPKVRAMFDPSPINP